MPSVHAIPAYCQTTPDHPLPSETPIYDEAPRQSAGRLRVECTSAFAVMESFQSLGVQVGLGMEATS